MFLAELNRFVWQNKIVAFKVILYLAYRKIVFRSGVKKILDTLDSCIDKLEKNLVPDESFLEDSIKQKSSI